MEAARLAARANRPDEYTPLGSRTWQDLGDDRWRSDINLTPEAQRLFNQQQQLSSSLGDYSGQALGRVWGQMSSDFDTSGLPQTPNLPTVRAPGMALPQVRSVSPEDQTRVGDALYRQATRYAQPQMERREQQMVTQLRNQGLDPQSDAYKNRMFDMEAERNRTMGDLTDRSILASGQEQSRLFGLDLAGAGQQFGQEAQRFGLGQQANQQQFGQEQALFGLGADQRARALQEQQFLRQLPLSEMNAFRTGAQVGMPQFQAYGQQGQTAGPNMLGAAQQQGAWDMNSYNQGIGQENALMSGLFGLGSAAMYGLNPFGRRP